jgi:hypothetical protein
MADEANAYNAFFANAGQTIGLEEAIFITINRAQGAHDAGNAFWEAQQLQAARQYEAQLAPLLQAEPDLLANLNKALQADGFTFFFTQKDVVNFQSSLAVGFHRSDSWSTRCPEICRPKRLPSSHNNG